MRSQAEAGGVLAHLATNLRRLRLATGLSQEELARLSGLSRRMVNGVEAGGTNISLAEPGFGFTNVIEGHPFAETPYYEAGSKSWIYGATYERRPNVAYNTAAFLFTNPK